MIGGIPGRWSDGQGGGCYRNFCAVVVGNHDAYIGGRDGRQGDIDGCYCSKFTRISAFAHTAIAVVSLPILEPVTVELVIVL